MKYAFPHSATSTLDDPLSPELSALAFGNYGGPHVRGTTVQVQPQLWYPGFRRDNPLSVGCIHGVPLWEGSGVPNNYANPFCGIFGTPHFLNFAVREPGNCLESNAGGGLAGSGVSFWTAADVSLFTTWTVSLWVYSFTAGSMFGGIWGSFDGSSNRIAGIAADSSTGLIGFTYNGHTNAVSFISAGTWYHLAMSYDGTNVNIYINGDKTYYLVLSPSSYWTEFACIGQNGITPWNGYTSNYLMYNRPLTDDEVNSLYQDPWQLYQPPVQTITEFGYNFDDVSPTGGFILGSGTSNTVAFDPPTSGGFKLASITEPYGGQHVWPSGGFILGDGAELPTYDTTVDPSGGFVLGGTAYAGEIEHTGGTFILGSATVPTVEGFNYPSGGFILGGKKFPSGYLYRIEVTVDATEQTLIGWVRPFTMTLAPLVSRQTVLVTDLNDVPLPYQTVQWNTSTGFLEVFVKINAYAGVETQFYVYFG